MGTQNDQKGFGTVETLLILVIIILIGVVGYMVYKDRHNTTKTDATSSAKKTKSPTKKAQVPPDPTAGWATYTSTAGGFSFKYPANGWTISGARDPGYTTVTGADQLNGNEYEVSLKENVGQNLSTDGNTYNIVIDVQPSSNTPNYVNAKAQPATYAKWYSEGTVTKLSNGLQRWQTAGSADSSGQCNGSYTGAATIAVVSDGNFYSVLPNGKYLQYEGDFCYGYRTKTSLTFQQQMNSPETAVAKEVLASFKLR